MIQPYSFNGVLLNPDDHFFRSDLRGAFSANKDLTLVDLLTDGQVWGRSKVKERTLVLNIIAGGYDLARITTLNAMIRGNGLKPLVIDTDIGRLVGYAEVVNFAWSDETALRISCQLTMPDPYWYALIPKSVQLGAQYSSGVVFGTGQGVTFGSRKNLLNPAAGSVTFNGVTCTVAADGTITLDGTATANIYAVLAPSLAAYSVYPGASYSNPLCHMQTGKPYTLSNTVISGGISAPASFNLHSPDAIILAINLTASKAQSTISFTGKDATFGYAFISSGTVLSAYTFRLQLEQGSTATEWAPWSDEGPGAVFGSATGASGTLTNTGNADAYPVITIVGTCSGISVANLATGKTIAVSAVLGEDDTLVIDCRPATCGVYLNGVANIGLKTSPGWIHCPPGDNQFSFARNSLQNKKHCTVQLNERWI